MVQTRFATLGMSGCLALTGCLLEPVNVPPQVDIDATGRQQALVRGAVRRFTAQVQDDEPASLSFAWGDQEGACPATFDAAQAKQGPSSERSYAFRSDKLGEHCVWVTATDRRGAVRTASSAISVVNQDPTIEVAVAEPSSATVPLGSIVKLRTLGSDADGDVVSVAVAIKSPAGETVAPAACGSLELSTCFRASTSGTWTITTTATDSVGGMTTSPPLLVEVDEDRPPCLEGVPASPLIVQDPTQPLALEVRATDDLDSVPSPDGQTSLATFRWRVWDDEARDWLTALDQGGRVFRIPANSFRLADSVRIRVDVSDRMPRPQLAAKCSAENDSCAATPECPQRLTWEVEFR